MQKYIQAKSHLIFHLTFIVMTIFAQSAVANNVHTQVLETTQLTPGQKKLMSGTPYKVELTPAGFKIEGRYTLLRGGSIQWFRLPPEVWEDRFKKLRAMGFNAIDMYIAWNQIESSPGVFNFDQPNIREFLDLAKAYGIYVVVRPGPYITNEMDGGGLPAWLTRDATKKNLQPDGKVNIRTHDPDFLAPVSRYFKELNKVLYDYTSDKGGPIILYTIENEYNWFERAFLADKIFWYEGGFERPWHQKLDPKSYFSALRDMVIDSGIRIPIISCPGDGRISALGDTEGVLPFPNIYEWANPGQPEQIAYELLSDMKIGDKHGGIYKNYPSGSLELSRSAQELRRLITGGLDAFFVFNLFGILQENRLNGMTMAARVADEPPHWGDDGEKPSNWLETIFDFSSPSQYINGFISPNQGFFGNIIDYNGPVSSSGVIRDLFFDFRRDNQFYHAIEPFIGGTEIPHVIPADLATTSNQDTSQPPLIIDQDEIGVREETGRKHYWHETANGSIFLSLVNQSGEPQKIDKGAIKIHGLQLPKYEPFVIPKSNENKSTYAQNLSINLPLSKAFTLDYTTSEIVTFRRFNSETLIVLYGGDNYKGEMRISAKEPMILDEDHASFERKDSSTEKISLTYDHKNGQNIRLQARSGEILRIMTVTSEQSGKLWFLKHQGIDHLLIGPDYVEPQESDDSQLFLSYLHSKKDEQIILFSPTPKTLALHKVLSDFNPTKNISHFKVPSFTPPPKLPSLTKENLVLIEAEEKDLDYDDSEWLSWSGEPVNLEKLDIFTGHAWYRTEFYIDDLSSYKGKGRLYIEHASDFVGVYINGKYLTTVAPIGTEIDNLSRHPNYRFESLKPHLRQGKNILAFRTEIWGHGSFMFGRGRVLGTKARIPAISYDGLKGLHGKAMMDKIPLSNWRLRPGLSDHEPNTLRSSLKRLPWQVNYGIPQLKKGKALSFLYTFKKADLPDRSIYEAPITLALKGRSTKATIYLNGRLLGRWLSDTNWLSQGSWLRPKRNMWSSLSADHFPIPYELMYDDVDNELIIIFEDTSSDKSTVGNIERVKLEYNHEGINWSKKGPIITKGIRARVETSLIDSQ